MLACHNECSLRAPQTVLLPPTTTYLLTYTYTYLHRYWNESKVRIVACCRDVALSELVDVEKLSLLYRMAGLPALADTIGQSAGLRLTELIEGGEGISKLRQLEQSKQFWLLGLAYGSVGDYFRLLRPLFCPTRDYLPPYLPPVRNTPPTTFSI